MRISFKRSGGFAALPALSRPLVIDTQDLPPEKARQVEGLAEAARGAPAPPADTRSRDAFSYTVEIEDGGAKHVIRARDGGVPPAAQPLIDWLSRAHDESMTGGAGKPSGADS